MTYVEKEEIGAHVESYTHLTSEAVVGLERAPKFGQPQRLAHVATILGRRHFLLTAAAARQSQLPIKGRQPAN